MPEAVPPLPGNVSRRALLGRGPLLGGAAMIVLPWLAGCAAEAAPRADVAVLAGAIASEQNLIATYEAVRSGAEDAVARPLDIVVAHHLKHLEVLKRHYVPGSGDRAHEGGTVPPPSAAPVPAGSRGLAALRGLEERAARARAAEAARSGPALAQLLASIGACEAGHAMAVRGGPPAVRSTTDAEAARAALAAEHAAVYGYGVLGSRLRGSLREAAKERWNAHRAGRDALTAVLSVKRVAAAPAYRLPVKVTSARTAVQLAVALEDALAPAYVRLAGASSADLRAFAADGAQRAAAWSARWRASIGAAPPSPAFPGLPPAALSPRPEPGE